METGTSRVEKNVFFQKSTWILDHLPKAWSKTFTNFTKIKSRISDLPGEPFQYLSGEVRKIIDFKSANWWYVEAPRKGLEWLDFFLDDVGEENLWPGGRWGEEKNQTGAVSQCVSVYPSQSPTICTSNKTLHIGGNSRASQQTAPHSWIFPKNGVFWNIFLNIFEKTAKLFFVHLQGLDLLVRCLVKGQTYSPKW